jgi:hypothetical protein
MIRDKDRSKAHKMKRKWRVMDAITLSWKTSNVVPLPGTWCNRYRRHDGRIILDPCPALLVQERGNDRRTCFATYHKGLLFPALDTDGYEESNCSGRTIPYRANEPPWELLDEIDPAAKVADEAANAKYLANSFVLPAPRETHP